MPGDRVAMQPSAPVSATAAARAADVSVVMITRDRRAEAIEAVRRLRALPERPPVIVVDNGSRDNTVAALHLADPGVRTLVLEQNIGAAARNLGVRLARTSYVAFSDDDSGWQQGALARALARFAADERLAVLAARILVGPEGRLDPTCRDMATRFPPDADGSVPVVGFVACGAVVRKDAFLEAGGFESRFGVGGEEALLAFDLLRAGWKLRYVDEVVALHWPSPSRNRAARRRIETRNALWLAWLRRPARAASRASWRSALAALHDRDCRAGMLDALAGLPWALRNRRPVPPALEALIDAAEAGR
jgi:GT2 family glycosyltransferase